MASESKSSWHMIILGISAPSQYPDQASAVRGVVLKSWQARLGIKGRLRPTTFALLSFEWRKVGQHCGRLGVETSGTGSTKVCQNHVPRIRVEAVSHGSNHKWPRRGHHDATKGSHGSLFGTASSFRESVILENLITGWVEGTLGF